MEKEITYSVYITQNLLDPAKAYVGMSKRNDPKYWGSDKVLQEDIKRLGVENFRKTILASFNDHVECHYWEGFYVKTMHTHTSEGGYNKTYSGGAYSIMTDEHCKNISIGNKGKNKSAEHCANLSIARKGCKLSPETCAKISVVHKGKKHAQEHSAKVNLANTGKKRSTEQCANIGAGHKGLKLSETHRKNIGLSRKGCKLYIDENGKRNYYRP